MKIKIGALAKMFGCPVVTVRYYEKEGLLKEPARTNSNYRLYGDEDIDRLRFIMHCRKHDISINEIRDLLKLRENPHQDCGYVHEMINRHIAGVDEKISALQNLKEELIALSKLSACEQKGNCTILRTLGASDGCSSCKQIQVSKGA